MFDMNLILRMIMFIVILTFLLYVATQLTRPPSFTVKQKGIIPVNIVVFVVILIVAIIAALALWSPFRQMVSGTISIVWTRIFPF